MKKTTIIILGLLLISVALNIALLGRKNKSAPEVHRLASDDRISVSVKPEHKEFVMNEMRLFLESLQLVNEGINNNDPGLIIRAAAQSGSSVKAPKDMIPLIPEGFLKLGRPTHKLFDIMADSAQKNFNPEVARQQFATQINNCISCHKAYRMDILPQ